MAAWSCLRLELRPEPVGPPRQIQSPSEWEELFPEGKSKGPTKKELLLLGKHEQGKAESSPE